MLPDRTNWDETWLNVAHAIANRSRCTRAQIGAVVVSKNQRICATGYNGPAATWPDERPCSFWCPRAQGEAPLDATYDACPAIHAEANALLYVDRSQVEGGTLYVTSAICMQCAKLVSNSGVSRVVMVVRDVDVHRKPSEVIAYLKKCGLTVSVIRERSKQ
jgi:dCMP deaminase